MLGMFGFVSRYHPTWKISMEVYVMADTQIESYAYEDQMTPKSTNLYVQRE